ncbi:MAG: type II secretion system ATPase GspE [Pseudoxanthomonas sp.]|nr:type II secretion system ATPase GspE [Pseudoxanthomonas sp.]
MAAAEAATAVRPPYAFARRHGVVVVAVEAGRLQVMHRPGVALPVLAELQRAAGLPLALLPCDEAAFERQLRQVYAGGDAGQEAAAMAGEDASLATLAEGLPEPEDLMESADEAPVIRLLNALLTQAVKENASDIHVEPFEQRVAVRLRVDGVLREVLTLARGWAPALASRVKVMARLDIAEKRLPQDGRIALRVAGRPVDVRVSTLPSGHGERVVLRLLDKQAGRLDLGQLGMVDGVREALDALIHRPHGIALVTGPTGSGKTTTLYAALERLNDATRNILTVEDPIEYDLEGIGQTQVNTRIDMSFARGLRAILRQDPDVVMVGEIRDLETAQIAVQASLTGHLVLSTLHTNTAIGAVTRLRDMGVEPFLLASSLLGVLAQRLVRVLDPAQREAYAAGTADFAAFGLAPVSPPPTLYRPRAGSAGYRGRTGIHELVVVDEAMRALIHDNAAEADLERLARTRTPGILADGWAKCVAGVTSVEEVLRVTRDS